MTTTYTNERREYFRKLLSDAHRGSSGRFEIELSHNLYNFHRLVALIHKDYDGDYIRIDGVFETDFPELQRPTIVEDKQDIAIYFHEHNVLIVENADLAKILMKYCAGIKVYSKEIYTEVYRTINKEFASRIEELKSKYNYTMEEFNDTLDYLYDELLNEEVKGEKAFLSQSVSSNIINDEEVKELLGFYLGNPVAATKQYVNDVIALESEYFSKAVKREFLKHLAIREIKNQIADSDLVLKAKNINELFKTELKETGRVYVTTHSGTVKIVRKNLWLINLTEMYVGNIDDINVKDIVAIEWEGKKFNI
ncbi:hypothetical protein [Priestia megaterium]|uniref:Uncharacterized protein n=1 Tax=Priestia megaterium TaxID=1404 RepID=A0A6M6EA37_PRIMG|nr:hypothetical protein [Priestia megaterium]QJX80435.1 hypothetical protein FDZ14_30575 [Priestia megaterium]